MKELSKNVKKSTPFKKPHNERALLILLQSRDLDLLQGLLESRVMTAAHVATLYFDGKKEATKKRLQKLKADGLISERARRVNEPAALFLTRKAFSVLRDNGVLARYPALALSSLEKRSHVSDLTLHHELEVMDVKAAFHTAIGKTSGFTVEEFSTWPVLYQFEAFRPGYNRKEVPVKPDGFIRIHETTADGHVDELTFFLEVDRSSETQEPLTLKSGCYFNYYKSGGFAERNGASRSDYKKYPFRVLIVLKNTERRNNLAERLLQINPPVLTHACLSTFDEVMTNPLGNIWISPRDYRDATIGTPFDPERRRRTRVYRRQTAREQFVDQNVKRHCILDPDATI